jgi:cytochrome c
MRSLLAAVGSVMALGVMASGPAAAQDAAAGEKIFLQCRTCHQIGPAAKNAVGPQLNGVFEDRKAGTAEGYSYSNAYKDLEKVWSVENFTVYIKDPRGVTPGTKMVYAGLKDEAQIANLIAFLQQYGKDGTKK